MEPAVRPISMPISHIDNKQSILSASRGVSSPGSSTFDLLTQLPVSPQLERKPALLPEIPVEYTFETPRRSDSPRFLVISGGTGGNSICSAFGNACYVLPVSDDGGSSSEIIRVLGGPSIGTFKCSCLRILLSKIYR